MLINNELIVQILGIAIPAISSLGGWLLSQNHNIFNSRKIQKYDLWDYQYTVYLFQTFYSIINPMIFLLGFVIANWISTKMDVTYFLQLMFFIEIYIAIVIMVLVTESEILSKRKEKLKTISSSISKELSEMMLSIDIKRNIPYKTNMFIFSMIWLALIIQFNYEVFLGIIIFWIIYYCISIIFMQTRLSKYKTKAIIKSRTIIKMDYTKQYNCYCDIILKRGFSFKIDNNNIIIYYPGDISSYTIKQDNLISITVGYKVE